MTEKQAVIQGLMTRYTESGTGSNVVLLLHGWGDSSKTFTHLQVSLSSSHRVLALDLPGFGGTDNPGGAWGLDEYALFVQAFTQKLNIDTEVLIGHSNGGAIIIRGLAKEYLSCSKLVLIASAGIRNTYQGRKKLLRLAAKGAKALTLPLPKRMQTKLKKKAYKTIGSDLFVAEDMQDTFKKVVTDDVQKDCPAIKAKSLLIYGTKDTATPVSYGRLFQQSLSKSELQTIEGAGHFVHHDAPEAVEKLVSEFIA